MNSELSTVNGWFSVGKKMPVHVRKIIEGMMKETELASSAATLDRSGCKAYSILLKLEDYELISRAAALENMTVEEWSERQLIRDAKARVRDASPYADFKAAEEPPPYGKDGKPTK